MNHGKILHAIEQLCGRDHSPTTVGAVAAFTGLSQDEVQEAVRELASGGLLCERAALEGGLLCIREPDLPIVCKRPASTESPEGMRNNCGR